MLTLVNYSPENENEDGDCLSLIDPVENLSLEHLSNHQSTSNIQKFLVNLFN